MMQPERLALLIDGDNTSPRYIADLLDAVRRYGTPTVKRIYGDWTKPDLGGWKDCLLEHSIQPIQQFAYTTGKNATDGAMIIDAMDLLSSNRFSGFCLVSSDSDFVRLAVRIREQGLPVYGFGGCKTPRPFVTACDRFIYLETLPVDTLAGSAPLSLGANLVGDMQAKSTSATKPGQTKKAGSGTLAKRKLTKAALATLRRVVQASADEHGCAPLSQVGMLLAKQHPDFDCRTFGHSQLSELAEACGILDVERSEANPMIVIVRLKGPTATTAA